MTQKGERAYLTASDTWLEKLTVNLVALQVAVRTLRKIVAERLPLTREEYERIFDQAKSEIMAYEYPEFAERKADDAG